MKLNARAYPNDCIINGQRLGVELPRGKKEDIADEEEREFLHKIYLFYSFLAFSSIS